MLPRDLFKNKIHHTPQVKYCVRPFRFFLIAKASDNTLRASCCCSAWLSDKGEKGMPVFNPQDTFRADLWNHPYFVRFRQNILKGDYSYCNLESCPYYQGAPHASGYDSPYVDIQDLFIEFAFDPSCNLSCPSCRSSWKTTPSPYSLPLLEEALKRGASSILLNGSGELFINTSLINFLNSLIREQAPNLSRLNIITNATLFTPAAYFKLSDLTRSVLHSISVSLDSLNPHTYKTVRRGANLQATLTNIDFLSQSLLQNGMIKELICSFVIQKSNFKEIPDFFNFALEKNLTHLDFWRWDNRNGDHGALSVEEEAEVSQLIKEGSLRTGVRVNHSF